MKNPEKSRRIDLIIEVNRLEKVVERNKKQIKSCKLKILNLEKERYKKSYTELAHDVGVAIKKIKSFSIDSAREIAAHEIQIVANEKDHIINGLMTSNKQKANQIDKLRKIIEDRNKEIEALKSDK